MNTIFVPTIATDQQMQRSIFLAGPTPRSPEAPNWRPEALKILEELSFDGTAISPTTQDWGWWGKWAEQVEWEWNHLDRATVILFWVPRDLKLLPGFTTNVEFGLYVASGKCVLGHPPKAPKTGYLNYLGQKHKLPIENNLSATLRAAIELVHARSVQ